MIALDTNILVYAHREDSPWHEQALRCLERDLLGRRWAIPWPCVHEFLSITTHPKVFDPPTPLEDALTAVEGWLSAPLVSVLGELDGYLESLGALLRASRVVGPRIHDARIAALCIQHGVTQLWTIDRDFSRFRQLATHNPLV